jgi:hypothetical protein
MHSDRRYRQSVWNLDASAVGNKLVHSSPSDNVFEVLTLLLSRHSEDINDKRSATNKNLCHGLDRLVQMAATSKKTYQMQRLRCVEKHYGQVKD